MVIMSKTSKSPKIRANYLKKLIYNIKLIITKVKLLREYVNSKTRYDLFPEDEQTLSQEFKSWLLDIVYYGILLTIIYNTFLGWQAWLNIGLIISFGIIRWFIFNTIREYRKL